MELYFGYFPSTCSDRPTAAAGPVFSNLCMTHANATRQFTSNPHPMNTNRRDTDALPGVLIPGPSKRPTRRRWLTKGLVICTWLYFAATLAVWALLWWGADHWWFPTVMLFGPGWLYPLPFIALAPAAALTRHRLLWVLTATAIIVVGPLMGFCVPWARWVAPTRASLRVLTCNVKGKCTDNTALEELIDTTRPDIVALQGCWAEVRIHWPVGWQVRQKEGLLIASRYRLRDRGTGHYWSPPGQWRHLDLFHCTVEAPEGDIDFCSVHLISPHEGIEAVIDRQTLLRPSKGPVLAAGIDERRQESEDGQRWIRQWSQLPILAGDFNMPTASAIYRRYWAEYRNAFSNAGLGFGYTEWPRIRGISWGIRIDHVLTGSEWRCRSCWVGPDVGSDHLPLIVDLASDSRRDSQ
jgi:vancomycin resistance protein VanJ